MSKSKKKAVHEQDTFISKYKNDYIQFYQELKQKDPTLYNYLKETSPTNCLNKLVFGKA